MTSRFPIHRLTIACLALAGLPAFAQTDVKDAFVKHLKISRDFTLKVADQMPAADYGFKMTPAQMSFGDQITHLAQAQAGVLAPFGGPGPGKPASTNKADIMAFVKKTFDSSIDTVSKLTPAQLSKTYTGGEGTMTGVEMLMFLMDHTTHHRASAEMYLRAKGITPTEYQF